MVQLDYHTWYFTFFRCIYFVSLLGNVNDEYYRDADILVQFTTAERLSTIMGGLEENKKITEPI